MTPEDAYLSKQRFLVVAPHPDDESFGYAGTMARIKDLGGEVYVMVCSLGDLKHYDGKEEMVEGSTREKELSDVMEYLKVDDYDILYRDAESHLRLDAIPRRDLIAKIERDSKLAYDRLKPTMMPSHSHRITRTTTPCFAPRSPPRARGSPRSNRSKTS